jgi:putative transcriptional regulator
MDATVANTIHAKRSESGWTQEELAERIGVTRQTIIAIEKGNYTPSVLLALKLSACFKVSVNDLFSIRHER